MPCSFLVLTPLTGCMRKWWKRLWSLPCLVMRQELLRCDICDFWVPSLLPAINVGLLNYGCLIRSQKVEIGLVSKLCAVSRNCFSEHLQRSRKQWLKWGTKTDFKQQRFKAELKCAHNVWALFILRYLSYIANVLITEVSALLVHVVWGQLLCRGQCWSLLPPFFCAFPTPLLGAAGYYFSFCLCAAEPVWSKDQASGTTSAN